MKAFNLCKFALFAILLGLTGCNEPSIEPTPEPTPEEVKSEIIIDACIITNGLSFTSDAGEKSISFTTNEDWTLSIAATQSGDTWCTASATNGAKGDADVRFTVKDNNSYDNRSVAVTIKSGKATQTFTISQKGVDALLITTNKYEVSQMGGSIEIEVKSNIQYEMEIADNAKDWITENTTRALTVSKHTFNIAINDEGEKREGAIYFKSGNKTETVKVYQTGGAVILLTQNEFTISSNGGRISVEIKSNIEFGVQMPNVDWVSDEVSTRGMSSHTLKFVVAPNEDYDNRSTEIIFYDKNSDLKDTLKIVQGQKDAIIIAEKNIDITEKGGRIEIKVDTNVDFEVQIPSDANWISYANTRSIKENIITLDIAENTGDENRTAEITIKDNNSDLSEKVTIIQKCPTPAGYVDGVLTIKTAGTMKSLLGEDYLQITTLKIVGPINGDDIYYLRRMLGYMNDGDLTSLDLSEAIIKEGGDYYYRDVNGNPYYTNDNEIGEHMFSQCPNLFNIILPNSASLIKYHAFYSSGLTSVTTGDGVTAIENDVFTFCYKLTSATIGDNVKTIGREAFYDCSSLTSISIGKGITEIGVRAFHGCENVKSVYIKDLSAWCNIDFKLENSQYYVEWSNPLRGDLYLNGEKLENLIIPENITKINPYTFSNCESLKSVTIGNQVTKIGEFAFYGCSSLTSLAIGDGVTEIKKHTFRSCSSLTYITIGKGVTQIGAEAFRWCGYKANFHCKAQNPPSLQTWSSISTFDGNSGRTLYVPDRHLDGYLVSSWADYFDKIVGE